MVLAVSYYDDGLADFLVRRETLCSEVYCRSNVCTLPFNEFWRYARKTDFYEEILYANLKVDLDPENLLTVLLKKKVLRAVIRKKLKKSFLYRLFK
jgi:hypothetical protein